MTRLTRIDEEVARFAFEVHLKLHCPDWFVAFTNPTAGPWKRVTAPDAERRWGEVHRFEREELRPDLVVVNDLLRVILVVEAKDDVSKLRLEAQASKSAEALDNIATVLASRATNTYWGPRAQYVTVCGLLWGAHTPAPEATVEALFRTHARYLAATRHGAAPIVGIECRGVGDRSVMCSATTSHQGEIAPGLSADGLVRTLALAEK